MPDSNSIIDFFLKNLNIIGVDYKFLSATEGQLWQAVTYILAMLGWTDYNFVMRSASLWLACSVSVFNNFPYVRCKIKPSPDIEHMFSRTVN